MHNRTSCDFFFFFDKLCKFKLLHSSRVNNEKKCLDAICHVVFCLFDNVQKKNFVLVMLFFN